jgi:MYXO-CTERM domain-containing protein
MTEERETTETESGEEQIDEQGRNPTQQRMDEEGVEAAPVDADWTGSPSGGPEGSDPAGPAESAATPAKNEPIFEPDVPLVAEVNRETPPKSRKGIVAAVAGAFAVLGAVVLRRRRR